MSVHADSAEATTPTADIENQRCDGCRFWRRYQCHRNPPVPATYVTDRWPAAYESEWCGEWAPAETGGER